MEMETIKENLKKAFDLMPEGSKQRAAEIHDTTTAYFRRVVAGEPKDIKVYHLALKAVKQASKEKLKEVEDKVKKISSI